MKRSIIFLAATLISLAASGQTDSLINVLRSKYGEMNSQYQENYDKKDFKKAEILLSEQIAFMDDFQFPEKDTALFRSVIKQIKAYAYYNLTCVYALQNQKKQAIEAFEKAVGLGFAEYRSTLSDSDLDNIRKDKKVVALMEKMKQFDKLVLLQSSGDYAQENTDSLPRFTYASANNRNLKEVKTYFNLDSVAGHGDEISKIKNLLFFATNSIAYDGSNWALCEFDAIDFYNYHKTTGMGINCRHKAMVLNEMYLAMGFKSRYVTRMPKDPDDVDCHVINSVYSETLKKWLWMDPSHGIYVTDEKGDMLSIAEVRERLKNDQPLALNKETSQKKEWYLDSYMAKNLYWLQCSNVSRFNTESRYRPKAEDLRYINLLPVGYENEENQYIEDRDAITHDPDYFWQIPEK